MKKVVITGGNGKTGRWVVKEFLDNGYEVTSVDLNLSDDLGCKVVKVDLKNLGQVYGVLAGADAVVHLAAIPRPRGYTSEVVFENNTISTYNILEAASNLGIKKVVIASSESVYGLPYGGPSYVPMDESHPLTPIDSYALSKVLNEKTAEMFVRKAGMQVVSLRIGNVMDPNDYVRFPEFKAAARKNILWSYIDARDVGSACRLAVEKDGLGAEIFNIAADDTSMNIKNSLLMSEQYPDVTDIRISLDGYETLLSNKKAKEILGWQPIYFWRNQV